MVNPIPFNIGATVEAAVNPSAAHITGTKTAQYFRRYLSQKLMSIFKWELPENWSKRYFLYALQCAPVAVFNTERFGVIPNTCTLSGLNVFYQPSTAIVANPLLPNLPELKIGENCVIFTPTMDYGGLDDLIEFYADQMALVTESFCCNINNSKLSYVFAAEDKAIAQSFKKAMDLILSGEPYVVADKKLFDTSGELRVKMLEQNVRQNYIGTELFEMLKNIENQFATEIGIPNSNTQKRERLITDEVNSNNVETSIRSELWLENLKESCSEVKRIFNVDVSVNWRYEPEVVENG